MNQRITKVRKKLQNGFGEAIPIGAKAENVTLNNGTILQDVIEELQTGRAGHADLTQAEYDALPQSQKNDGTIYFVADGAAGTNNAAAVRYSNTGSGLSATNVQSAIDEVNENVETQVSALKAVDATLKDAATKTVANNLVTTSQGYVLDARQGKALSDSVAALNSSLETLKNTSTDGAVDLKGYNTSSNIYVFPYDGYVYVDSGSGATSGTYIRFTIRASNGTNTGGVYMNVTGSYQTQSVFVKKGMYGFLAQVNATNNYAINFVPLNYK